MTVRRPLNRWVLLLCLSVVSMFVGGLALNALSAEEAKSAPSKKADAAAQSAQPKSDAITPQRARMLRMIGAAQPAQPKSDAPPPPPTDDLSVKIYRLKHIDGTTLLRALQPAAPVSNMTFDSRTNSMIVTALAAGHKRVAELIEILDVPPKPDQPEQIKVFSLLHTDAEDASQIVLLLFDPRGVRIAVDPRTNSLLATGPESDLQVIEAILLRLDEAEDRPVERASTPFHVRIVWLATGLTSDDFPELPSNLNEVKLELLRLGVTDVRQIGQAAVYTLPDGRFQISCAPMFDQGPAQLEIRGELEEQDGTPRLDISISAEQAILVPRDVEGDEAAESIEFRGLVNLETEITAPYGHYVVLGVAPVGKTTSVFVVQVTPSRAGE